MFGLKMVALPHLAKQEIVLTSLGSYRIEKREWLQEQQVYVNVYTLRHIMIYTAGAGHIECYCFNQTKRLSVFAFVVQAKLENVQFYLDRAVQLNVNVHMIQSTRLGVHVSFIRVTLLNAHVLN
jgi:hypothetical protein